MLDLYERI